MTATLDERCREAIQVQLNGNTAEAERLYRSVLQAEPAHATANYCLGMLKVQSRDPGAGLPYLTAALHADASNRQFWLGLLDALLLAQRPEDAAAMLDIARANGLAGPDIDAFGQRLRAALPSTAQKSRAERRRDDKTAIRDEEALAKMIARGQFSEATTAAQSLTQRFPERGQGWKTLGALWWAQGKKNEAISAMRSASNLMPEDAETFSNLGISLALLHRFSEAESALSRAIEIDPEFSAAHSHLGDVYLTLGRLDDAEGSYRRACVTMKDAVNGITDSRWHSLLFILSHKASLDPQALFAEHVQAGKAMEAPFRHHRPVHHNSRRTDRILNVGFVSGDFKNHAVANFVEPVFECLQRCANLHLHAYYNHDEEDAVTARLKLLFHRWNRVEQVTDNDLARKIASDGIDILVDLSGHTAHNRLAVFARKPAPIQVSWIGYAGTTGLTTMDYYLADRHFLPAEQFATSFTEKLVYLPANVPFRPHPGAPAVAPLPAAAGKGFTFGSFNRLGKIDATTLDAWAAILRAVPDSRMIIGAVKFEGQQERLVRHLQAAGIAPQRLEFRMRGPMDEYLAHHHDVDLCLDTYPYTGGTTTIHALWMGVPTLTIAGATPVSRQGAAILGQLQLDEFVARDASDCVDKAVYWAAHRDELAAVRASLRERWQNSPARHPEVISASLERAFAYMWLRWCEGSPPASFVAPTAHQKDAGT